MPKTELTIHHVLHADHSLLHLLYLLLKQQDRNDPEIKAEIAKLKASSDKLEQAVDAAGDVPAT